MRLEPRLVQIPACSATPPWDLLPDGAVGRLWLHLISSSPGDCDTWAAVVYFRELRWVWIKPFVSPPGATARSMGNHCQQGRCRNPNLTQHSCMGWVQPCWIKQLSLYLHAEHGQNLTIPSHSLNSRNGSRQERKKNLNNYQGAKQGLTAPGRSCQSPRLGRLQ